MLLRCAACSRSCVSLGRERAPTGWRSTPRAPTPDSPVMVCGVPHAQQVVGPSNPGNLPPVTGVERHLPRAHSGSRRLARHPAAEEVATTGEDESNTLSSSSTVRASPCCRLSNHPALLEPLSEPLLAPITPLLAVGGCGRRPPPVPRVTDLIVSCTPQTAERWRRCRRTWAVAASSSRACGGVAVAARSPSARHAYAVRRRLGPAGGGYQTAAAPRRMGPRMRREGAPQPWRRDCPPLLA